MSANDEFRLVAVVVVIGLLSTGCSSERKPVNEKPVVPVTGTVHIDGAPVADIEISFHPQVQADSHRVFPKATTDAEGRFEAWSYRKGDGIAAGNYTLTFIDRGGPPKPFQRASDRPDLFQGKYSDPENTEHRLTVPEDGEPIDMGVIELTRP